MQNKIIISIVAIVLVGGGLFYLTKNSGTPPPDQNKLKNTSKLPLVNKAAESKATTSGVVMGTSLAPDGTVAKPVTVFSKTTPSIYAVLPLQNTSSRTQISYIRYYNGKYVDSKVSHPSRNGAKYFHFQWKLKSGKINKAGNYKLVFYVNGKKTQTVSYTVK
ncbi:MAG TPA: hypothetical protein VF974_05660 [Patescibacteria group bacterium]